MNKNYRIPQWKFKNADWDKYRFIIEDNLERNKLSVDENNINHEVEIFTNIISQAAQNAIGHTTSEFRKPPVPWWSDECDSALKQSHKALNKYQKTKKLEDKILFKRKKSQARRIIISSKRKSWQTYLSTLSSQTPAKEVWIKIKNICGKFTHMSINNLIDSYGNQVH